MKAVKAVSDIFCVERHFLALCRDLGLKNAESQQAWSGIYDAYLHPDRHYHNMSHLADMLGLIEQHAIPNGIPRAQLKRLRAFVIFHDIVYETASIDAYRRNESESAKAAEKFLRMAGADEAFITSVTDLVLASQTHKMDAAADPWGAFALDIDMAVLAAPKQNYMKYAAGIRQEFARMAQADFYKARLERFLRPTLAGSRIFMTDLMHEKYDARARVNLRREERGLTQTLARMGIRLS